jgi:hypothetical protein
MYRTCMPISISTRRLSKKLRGEFAAAIFDLNARAASRGGFFVTPATDVAPFRKSFQHR